MNGKAPFKKGPRCGVDNCPSTLFCLEDNGLTYCEEGHQQHGQVAIGQDEEDFGTQGRKSRQQREFQEKVSRIYRGPEALELYLQAYQLILRKQCWTLVHTFYLPAELETVVKDLWELRVQLLKDRLEKVVSAEIVYSSQQQSEDEAGNSRPDHRKWEARGKETPSIMESLGLHYMTMAILRLPISLGDLHRWAMREDIPFIRVIREVPTTMKEKLPGQYRGALDTKSLLNPDDLRRAIHELILLYNHSFGLVLPDLNHPLLLFRYVRELALPLDIFSAVRSLSKMLCIDFSFPKKTGGTQRTVSFPELQLMALVIISVKLYHPFDNVKRTVHATDNLGTFQLDWDVWCIEHKRYTGRETSDGKLGRGNEMKVKEQDVFNMSKGQLDEYLDWYEKTWVNEPGRRQKKGDLPKELLDMFPTGRYDGSVALTVDPKQAAAADKAAIDAKLQAVQGKLKARDVVSKEDEKNSDEPINRIGSFYKRYRTSGELPTHAKIFFEAAASLIAVSLSTMVTTVSQTESALLKYRNREVRKEKEAEGSTSPMEGVVESGNEK